MPQNSKSSKNRLKDKKDKDWEFQIKLNQLIGSIFLDVFIIQIDFIKKNNSIYFFPISSTLTPKHLK